MGATEDWGCTLWKPKGTSTWSDCSVVRVMVAEYMLGDSALQGRMLLPASTVKTTVLLLLRSVW